MHRVESLPSASGISAIQCRVFLLSFVVIFVDGFDTQVISYVTPMIAAQWHLRPGAMGPVFSAGLFGLMLGALFLSPVADRLGRRRVIIPATFGFALLSLLTALAGSLAVLALVRFATGLALGAALTNAIALASDYSPTHRRGAITMIVTSGVSLGSLASGFLTSRVGAAWGWQAMFVIGGILPLLLGFLMMGALPESVHRLTRLNPSGDQSGTTSMSAPNMEFVPPPRTDAEADADQIGLRGLFTPARRSATPLIWLAFAATMLMLYLIVNWLPTVLTSVGFTAPAAAAVSTFYQVGALAGTLVLALLIDRLRPHTAVLIANAVCIASLLAYSFVMRSAGEMTPIYLLGIGFGTVGGQIALIALSTAVYPSFLRATGLGWGLGIGRIGSIAGPLLGGLLISRGLQPEALLRTCMAAVAVCALAVVLMPKRAPAA